ncbi:MAG TPA: helicase [Prevotella sp.]|nr:helicase [Prevotella sp.]
MKQNSFITNQEKLLSDIITGILPKSVSVDILVGYFYFSGYALLAKKMTDKKIRILVGLDIDSQISKYIHEVDSFIRKPMTRGQIREDYYHQLVKLFNDSDFLDSADKLQSFKLFYEKIKNGTLEIRKTEEPCHAKMYLFEYSDMVNEGGEEPGSVITGSSNLSYQGLAGRVEINARFTDKTYYHDGKKIFNELWDKSVEIANKEKIDNFNTKVIKRIWYDKLYSPYLLYIRVLYEYFNIPTKENVLTPYDITDGKYSNLKYQTDAVLLTLNAIERHNGAIVADVVGLGKSIIASTVARNLHLRTIVICPPHLLSQWEMYRDEFGFTAAVYSSGQIERALKHYQEIVKPDEKYLIIVDEAHRYRNEYTQDYGNLHNLCSGNKVLLLTATPFNNKPDDIYSMLKLFQIPTKSTLKTVENLGVSFRNLIATYKQLIKDQREGKVSDEVVEKEAGYIARNIRSIISPLVVRRSRIDLQQIPQYAKDLKKQKIHMVVPNDPVELEYDLSKLKDLYLKTLDRIDSSDNKKDIIYRFKAARYSPVLYVPDDKKKALKDELEKKTGVSYGLLVGRQANVSKFMRRLLVRRFESSVAAFQKSLDFMIKSSENILNWVEKTHKIPVYKKGNIPIVEDFYSSTEDGMTEIEEAFEKYTKRGFFEIDMKYINGHFIEDVKADISLLKDIQKQWFGEQNRITFDPKLDSFKNILHEKMRTDPKRKLIVFTEFADTADYIGKQLAKDGLPVLKYTSADASATNKDSIRYNFDAGVKPELQHNDYHILVATDAISEGYNLHRAGAIFNYDIPYNPTRVIQRIGRINRINKKMFNELYIYNYFPTDVGESETRTKEISTLKMAMIHAIMGEDTKALTKDEQVQAFFKERYRREIEKSEVASWDSPYRKLLDELKGTEAYRQALEIPHRARTGRQISKPQSGVLLFGKKGNDFVFKISNGENTPVQLPAEQALALFEAKTDEEPVALSEQFDKTYQRVKASLFTSKVNNKNDKELQEAFSKLKVIARSGVLDKDYMHDLLNVTMKDGLSGYELRFINQLKPKDYVSLPYQIEQDYLDRIVKVCNDVDEGEETLILSEEITN